MNKNLSGFVSGTSINQKNLTKISSSDNEYYLSILDSINSMIFVYDIYDGITVWSNQNHKDFFKRILDNTPHSYNYFEISKYINKKQYKKLLNEIETLIEIPEKNKFTYEYLLKNKKESLWLEAEVSIFKYDNNNKLRSLIFSVRDITLKKIAEEQSIQNEIDYQNLVELSPYGIIKISLDGKILSVNNAFLELSGYSKEYFIGKHFLKIPTLIKQSYSFYKNLFDNIIKEKKEEEIAFRWKHSSGKIHYAKGYAKIVKPHKGKAYIYGTIRDLTDQIEAENEVIELDNEFKQVFEAIPDAIIYTDLNRDILNVNSSFENLFGYKRKDIIGKSTKLIYSNPQDFERQGKERFNASVPPNKKLYELELKKKNGETFISESLGTQLKDSKNQVIGFMGMNRDITKRKIAEEILKENESQFRKLFEDFPISLWEEDFSDIKSYLDQLPEETRDNLEDFFEEHPGEIDKCLAKLKVIHVNAYSLELFKADSIKTLINAFPVIFTEDSHNAFEKELCWLYYYSTPFKIKVEQRKLDGKKIIVKLVVMIAPGYRDTWERVYVSISDVTEEHKAKAELAKHKDELEEEISRRIKELKNKNDELIHYNKLFIGREFRIKELREEVKALKQRIKELT